jgi:myosin protein heavy chain
VLDIAGFEIFENNSFEQLCINYTNEKLQQFFNNHMFKLEQEEYAREKITWTYIDFGLDSVQTIELIDKKDNSIIALLDEETIFPRATDESLIMKLHTLAKKHTKYGEVQFKKLNFQIQHYAGDVVYNVTDWITKNKDPLQDDIAKAIQASKNSFFASLFSDPDLDPRERLAQQKAAAAEAAGKKKAVTTSGATFLTVASAYKDQLADLMDTLRATEPNFIRCLIPNLQKKQQSLNAELILEQLACNGVLEGIRISRKGYPNRVTYSEFTKRFYLLHPTLKRNEPETKEATKKVMAALENDLEKAFAEGDHPKPLWQFGLTKIFFRHGVLAKIEETREKKLGQMVVTIQAGARGWLGRSAFRKMGSQTAAARILQKNMAAWIKFKQWNWWQLFAKSKPLLNKVGIEVVIKELEDRVANLEKEIAAAKSDRDKLSAEYQNKKEMLLRLREDVNSLNGRINRLDSESRSLQEENSSLSRDLAQLEERLSSTSKSRSATDKDLQDAETRLDKTKGELKTEDARVVELEALKKQHVAKLDANKAREAELKDLNNKLTQKEGQLAAQLSTTRDLLDNAENKGKDTKRVWDKLVADKQDAADDLADNKSAISKASAGVAESKARVAEAHEELESTRAKTKGVKTAVAGLQSEIADLQKKLEGVNREIAEADKRKKKLEADVQDTRAEADDNKAAAANVAKKNKALSADIDALDQKKVALELARDALENSKRSVGTSLADKQKELSDLSEADKRAKKTLADTQAKLAAKKDALAGALAAADSMEKSNKKAIADIKTAQDGLANVKSENSRKAEDKFKAQLKSVQDNLAASQGAVTAAQGENTKLKAELENVEGDVDAADKGVATTLTKLKALQSQLADNRADAEDEGDARAAADKAAKKAQADLADAKRAVAGLEAQQTELESKLKRVIADGSGKISKVCFFFFFFFFVWFVC